MDSRTENLKADLKRLYIETAERVVCRRLDSLVGRGIGSCSDCRHANECAQTKAEDCPWLIQANAYADGLAASGNTVRRVVGTVKGE